MLTFRKFNLNNYFTIAVRASNNHLSKSFSVEGREKAGVPPSPVISEEAVQSPNQKTWMQRDTPG